MLEVGRDDRLTAGRVREHGGRTGGRAAHELHRFGRPSKPPLRLFSSQHRQTPIKPARWHLDLLTCTWSVLPSSPVHRHALLTFRLLPQPAS